MKLDEAVAIVRDQTIPALNSFHTVWCDSPVHYGPHVEALRVLLAAAEGLKSAVYCIDTHYDDEVGQCDCDQDEAARAVLLGKAKREGDR